MASAEFFQGVPPFPDDVKTISIDTISLASLNSGDNVAAQKLLSACQQLGFFLLDLSEDETGQLMTRAIDQLLHLSEKLFDLPEEVKQAYLHDIPKSFLGFKPRGQARTETEEPDRFEWFNIGQDGLMGTTALQSLPPLMHDHLHTITSFLQHGQKILALISSTLATQLSLPGDTFTSLQRPTEPSGTVIRMIKAFATPEDEVPRTAMIHHTDFGTITLLVNVVGGLQILPPGKEATDAGAWEFIRPRPGCLVVNLGDAMVQWTGGLLRSNVHRINSAPGQQRTVDRYSLAILARPERDARMRHRVGGAGSGDYGEDDDLSTWEWEVRKAMSLKRGDTVVQSKGGTHPRD